MSGENLAFIILVWMFVGGVVGSLLGDTRGRGLAGAALGALAGPMGWIAVLLLTPTPDKVAEHLSRVRNSLVRIGLGPNAVATEIAQHVARELRKTNSAQPNDADSDAFRQFRSQGDQANEKS